MVVFRERTFFLHVAAGVHAQEAEGFVAEGAPLAGLFLGADGGIAASSDDPGGFAQRGAYAVFGKGGQIHGAHLHGNAAQNVD